MGNAGPSSLDFARDDNVFGSVRSGCTLATMSLASGLACNLSIDFPFVGTLILFGLDPTGAPLLLRNVSITDVYALTLEGK